MPDSLTFFHGFGLYEDKIYAGYKLIDIEATHTAVVTYHEYNYHIVLTYEAINPEMTPEEFFEKHIFEDKTILTRYGNPYHCHLERYSLKLEDDKIIIILSGHSLREN